MEFLKGIYSLIYSIIDFIFHVEVHLEEMIRNYSYGTYGILFLIIFCETGLVVTPFLPGDSLLFAIGAFSARGALDFWAISILLFIAAVMGDGVNYTLGKKLGSKWIDSVTSKENTRLNRLLNRNHFQKAQLFYEKYGPVTIVLARFIPIIRTFAPFVAGVGEMRYSKFMFYNVLGAFFWIFSFITLGHFFGNLPFVQKNFKLVIVAIIFFSVLPPLIGHLKQKRKFRATP